MPRPKGSKNKKKTTPPAPGVEAGPEPLTETEKAAGATMKGEEKKPTTEKTPAAGDLAAQTNTHLEGDTWANGKLLRRKVPGKTTTVKVERPATTEERASAAQRLAHARRSLRALKLEKKTYLGDIKKRETELDEEEELALLTYDQNLVMRNVKFDLFYDFENNVKYRVAQDNGEERESSALEPHERQSAMPGIEKTKVLPLRVVKDDEGAEKKDPDAPEYGSVKWVQARAPGFSCLDGHRDYFLERFTEYINGLRKLTPPRSAMTAEEVGKIFEKGMPILTKRDLDAKAAEDAAKPPEPTSPDGGSNAKTPTKFVANPDALDFCANCKRDEFDHDEDGTCPTA